MSNFFQNTQNYGFWNFDVWFLSRGKKSTVNCCLHECKHIVIKKKNERISLSPTQYCALQLNLFVTLRQNDSSIDGKNGELLSSNLQTPSQRQKKMLYCAQKQSSLQSNSQIYFHFLKLRRCSNESTVPL